MKNYHIIKSFRQRLDVVVRSWFIMYDTRFTKTFRDYGLPSADEFPLSSLAVSPKFLEKVEDEAKQIADALGMGDRQSIEIKTPLEPVVVSRWAVDHIAEKAGRGKRANFIRPTLESPNEIWLWYDPKRKVYRQRFIKMFRDPDNKRRKFFAVAEEGADGNILITSFRASTRYINKQRVGVLLYGG